MPSSPWRRATLALLPVAALLLAACGPTVAPAPPVLKASASSGGRAGWPTTDKGRYVATPCTGTYDDAVETCHLTYANYKLDTTFSSAHATAVRIATNPFFNKSQCSTNLNAWHSGQSANPTPSLQAQYPGVSGTLAENLFCYYFTTTTSCASAQLGAQKAIAGWIASTSHHATMNAFIGKYVNGGAYCNPATGIYVAVAQFHS